MHWADIQAKIYKAGTTPSKIADQENVSRAIVSDVIRSRRTSHKVAYAIAAITGLKTEDMWPGVYLKPPAANKASHQCSTDLGQPRRVVNA